MLFDAKKHTENCVRWIKDWFATLSGGAKGAILGISGGKDSTVVAGLLYKALGVERVFGVLMPNGEQKDIADSRAVCDFLGIKNTTINIEKAFAGLTSELGNVSAHTKTNIQPRLRMTTLYALGQEMNYRVAGTGNASEKYIGYTTKWGDSVCDFNPIASFTTEEVVAIGHELGLPKELVEKTPSDGLCGKTDEDNIGFSYAVLNRYIREGVCDDAAIKQKIDRLHSFAAHKFEALPYYKM